MNENDKYARIERRLATVILLAGMTILTLLALSVASPSRAEVFPAPVLEGMTSFGCDALTILPSEAHVDFISHARAWAEHGQGRDWIVSLGEHHEKSLIKARGRAQHDCAGWIRRMEALIKTHPMTRPRSRGRAPRSTASRAWENSRGPERAREAMRWEKWRKSSSDS